MDSSAPEVASPAAAAAPTQSELLASSPQSNQPLSDKITMAPPLAPASASYNSTDAAAATGPIFSSSPVDVSHTDDSATSQSYPLRPPLTTAGSSSSAHDSRPKSSRPIRSTTLSRMEAEEKITGGPSRPQRLSLRRREPSLAGSAAGPSGRAPRLRLNMRAAGTGVGGQGPKTTPYMQGYDRELDSSDDETGEGLAFEEQLILRMPPGAECEKLRELVRKRELGTRGATEVEFKFKDSRRATFRVGSSVFAAKLVDLPSIVESHKTLDNRQLFKIADISQMLLVTHRIDAEAPTAPEGNGTTADTSIDKDKFNIDDFIYPHGITPPMRWARKRRFRKRTNKRTIETVEKELERLMKDDDKAEEVEYEMIDAAEADLSDSDSGSRGGRGARLGSEAEDGSVTAATPRESGMGDMDSQIGDGDADMDDVASVMGSQIDADEEVDEDLAAELEAALEQEDLDDEDSDNASASLAGGQSRASEDGDLWDADADVDGGDRDGDGSGAEEGDREADGDSDEEGEQAEIRVREEQLEAECREIDAMVRRKQAEADATVNSVIKARQQNALKHLSTERDLKRAQLADLKQERRERREAAAEAAAAAALQRALEREQEAERDAQQKDVAKDGTTKDTASAVEDASPAPPNAQPGVLSVSPSSARKTAAEKGKGPKKDKGATKSSQSRSPSGSSAPTPALKIPSATVSPLPAAAFASASQLPPPTYGSAAALVPHSGPSASGSDALAAQPLTATIAPAPQATHELGTGSDADGDAEEEDDLWAAGD